MCVKSSSFAGVVGVAVFGLRLIRVGIVFLCGEIDEETREKVGETGMLVCFFIILSVKATTFTATSTAHHSAAYSTTITTIFTIQ